MWLASGRAGGHVGNIRHASPRRSIRVRTLGHSTTTASWLLVVDGSSNSPAPPPANTLGVMITLAIEASLALLVFSLGLRARFADATLLFRHPRLLARAIISMNVIMPLLALWAAAELALTPAIKLALVCLAMSPMPPFLPRAAMKAGGAHFGTTIGRIRSFTSV